MTSGISESWKSKTQTSLTSRTRCTLQHWAQVLLPPGDLAWAHLILLEE